MAGIWGLNVFIDHETASFEHVMADIRKVNDRYGLAKKNFPDGYPASNSHFTLKRGTGAVTCKTYSDRTILFCPKPNDPRVLVELPRKEGN